MAAALCWIAVLVAYISGGKSAFAVQLPSHAVDRLRVEDKTTGSVVGGTPAGKYASVSDIWKGRVQTTSAHAVGGKPAGVYATVSDISKVKLQTTSGAVGGKAVGISLIGSVTTGKRRPKRTYMIRGRPAKVYFDFPKLSPKRIIVSKWPWVAMLRAEQRFVFREPVCGGALINSRYVLTAAHCVEEHATRRDTMVVRLGEYNRRTFQEGAPVVEYEIEKFIVPPNYIVNTSNHDIALLRLAKEVQFSPTICTIPLPTGPTGDLANQPVSVAGWGRTENAAISNTLQEIHIFGVSAKTCHRQWRRRNPGLDRSSYFPGGFKVETKICARAKKRGTGICDGDSGAPLVDTVNFRLVGVTSARPKYDTCGFSRAPELFTRVSAYLDWIRANTNIPGVATKTQHCTNPF